MVSHSHALPLVVVLGLLGGNQLCVRVADRLALCYGGCSGFGYPHEGLLFSQALRSFLLHPTKENTGTVF